eukprot:gene2753-1786_t
MLGGTLPVLFELLLRCRFDRECYEAIQETWLPGCLLCA